MWKMARGTKGEEKKMPIEGWYWTPTSRVRSDFNLFASPRGGSASARGGDALLVLTQLPDAAPLRPDVLLKACPRPAVVVFAVEALMSHSGS